MRFFKKIHAGRHLLHRIARNTHLRVGITLLFSLLFHTAYVIFQIATGLYYRGRWLYALAFYDVLLTAVRFFLLRDLTSMNISFIKEIKRYRFCGVALLLAMPALIGIVTLIVFAERPLAYRGITTLFVSLYTLASFVVAVFSLFKYRRCGSPLLLAAKAVSLTTASVSLLSLEIALLFTLGSQADLAFRRIVTGLSGMAVCIFVFLLSLRMIKQANNALRLTKDNCFHGQ